MHRRGEQLRLISGSRVTALGTLASRVLGMLRDSATAALFGLSGGGVMDAFVVAFRIPNILRRLFGEGALAVSYLPVLSAALQRDRREGWKLASVVLVRLGIVLLALVLAGEAGLVVLRIFGGESPETRLLVSLSSVLLPYTLFICLAAQASATLHALGRFALPALVPTILNLAWLVGVLVLAPYLSSDKETQAHIVSATIVAAGVMQLAVQIPGLRRAGFRFDYDPSAIDDDFWKIVGAMGPMVLGLMITQLNTLMDSLIAWAFAAPDTAARGIGWLGNVAYPMEQGAVAALYYGERLYQFPLGILGIAVATAIFPLLSRHAARRDYHSLGEDLTLGLRLVLFLGIPAGVGLALLSEPLARLIYERHEFTSADTARTARVIAAYSIGVWAYCALPVLVRGFYALGDRLTPVRVGVSVVALNFGLNLALIWPMAESGLAVATSVGASVQAVALSLLFARKSVALDWSELRRTALRTLVATGVMAAAYEGSAWLVPPGRGWVPTVLEVLVPLTAATAAFLAAAWFLGAAELGLLFSRPAEERETGG
ncbi:MAG: murein biosynthesis integral membrane protein MurJ [Thermoguttaceae bacterium]